MSVSSPDGSKGDGEIFFGKMTLEEVKKRLFWNLKPCASSAVNSPREYEDHNTSVKILESHSAPNLLSVKDSVKDKNCSETVTSGWDMREDDSFIKLENMVAKLCVSPGPPNCSKPEELNNTLEVIEYILNNPPSDNINNEIMTDVKPVLTTESEVLNEVCLKKLQHISPQKSVKVEQNIQKDSPEVLRNTPLMGVKLEQNIHKDSTKVLLSTPVKSQRKYAKEIAGFMTPVGTKTKPVFKTPAQPLSLKKPSVTSLKKTPSYKSNAYEHISSPVASYIKNCPIVPLVKDVHPKKPLPGPSSIPKFKNHVAVKASNKENINLPSVAYKSAKKTKVIDLPDEQKLPQSQWAKKIMTSLPRPVVMKHDQREMNFAKRRLLSQQEDSFADLPYQQAEVSICTQKTAFKSN
ncbi:unnamed protein product [Arctia plantaginis]|uniref:Uncharacterized protein n=1 Tax=Arctia plantaginis TaxID=874455 RepID=A0A8S1A6G3_ARCPL|nr:unnamed protein product [Arctia plantaginis]